MPKPKQSSKGKVHNGIGYYFQKFDDEFCTKILSRSSTINLNIFFVILFITKLIKFKINNIL